MLWNIGVCLAVVVEHFEENVFHKSFAVVASLSISLTDSVSKTAEQLQNPSSVWIKNFTNERILGVSDDDSPTLTGESRLQS